MTPKGPVSNERQRLLQARAALSAALLSPARTKQSHDILRLYYAGGGGGAYGFAQYSALNSKIAPPVIHAVGMGRKIRNGRLTDSPAVRVYVTRKDSLNVLPASERIPPEINGVPTDIIEAAPARFLGAPGSAPCTGMRTSACRPVLGGISTSHVTGDTGTIACFCQSTLPTDPPPDIFILSNAHIYAKYGAAQRGDDVLQAGVVDGGVAAHRIGGFHRSVPLVFGGASNLVDAAIARLDPPIGYKADICSIGRVNGTAQAVEDQRVAKHGRTSGYTEGIVDDELIDFIMLPDGSTSYIQFRAQMRLVPDPPTWPVIAQTGDSGSLVVSQDEHQALGLLHAAAIDGSYAYANHIADVLKQLDITLL